MAENEFRSRYLLATRKKKVKSFHGQRKAGVLVCGKVTSGVSSYNAIPFRFGAHLDFMTTLLVNKEKWQWIKSRTTEINRLRTMLICECEGRGVGDGGIKRHSLDTMI